MDAFRSLADVKRARPGDSRRGKKRVAGRRPGGRLRRAAILSLICLPVCTAAAGAATTWQLARGPSAVNFSVSHLLFSQVEGRFTRFGGSVELPGESFEEARIEADIDVASIHTGHRDRDRYLVSDEFLAVEAYPRIRFVSRAVRRTAPDTYEIVGDLTIRGITREIVLDAKSMGRRETTAGARLDFEAIGSLNRYDYGLRWNRIWEGRALLGEEVEIQLKVCLVESSEPARQAVSAGRAAGRTSARP
jgi:polyisoprenoid-binding protein YceI